MATFWRSWKTPFLVFAVQAVFSGFNLLGFGTYHPSSPDNQPFLRRFGHHHEVMSHGALRFCIQSSQWAFSVVTPPIPAITSLWFMFGNQTLIGGSRIFEEATNLYWFPVQLRFGLVTSNNLPFFCGSSVVHFCQSKWSVHRDGSNLLGLSKVASS